jgi:tetratricopeptide (TPR) repeat protein
MRQSVLSVVLSDKLAHAEMLDTLAKFALRQRSAGKRFVVIIDDADKLGGQSLGSILQIAELSNRGGNLVQVVLSGQPAFRTRLASLAPTSFGLAETWTYELAALSTIETTEYIGHRMRMGGEIDAGVFTPAACVMIADISRGVPAAINSLCEKALETVLWRERKATIDGELIARLADEGRLAAARSKSRVPAKDLPRLRSPGNSVNLRQTGLALLNGLTKRRVLTLASAGLATTILFIAVTALHISVALRASALSHPSFVSNAAAHASASSIPSHLDQELGNLSAMRSEKPPSSAPSLNGASLTPDASSRHPIPALHEPQKRMLASALSRSALHDGVELMRKGDYDDALSIFHAAFAADPDNPGLRDVIAQAASAKRAEQSVLNDQSAESPKLKSKDKSSNPFVGPGESNHSPANSSPLASRSKARESADVVHAQDSLGVGRKLLASGDYDGAIKIFEAGLVTDPGRNELRDEIARAYQAKATEELVLEIPRDITKP